MMRSSIIGASTMFNVLIQHLPLQSLFWLKTWRAYRVTDRIDVVINCTPICGKIKSKHINLMKITRIEGYNSKYGLNPHGIREISYDLFEFDQIGQ